MDSGACHRNNIHSESCIECLKSFPIQTFPEKETRVNSHVINWRRNKKLYKRKGGFDETKLSSKAYPE